VDVGADIAPTPSLTGRKDRTMKAHQLTLKSDLLNLLRKAEYEISVYPAGATQSVRGKIEIAGIGWFRVGDKLLREDLIERISVFPDRLFASIEMGGVKPNKPGV